MRKFKGIELPVNAVIIIALAIFVLLMMAAFFSNSGSEVGKTQLKTAFDSGCSQLSQLHQCSTEQVDKVMTNIVQNSKALNLLQVCQQYYNNPLMDAASCVRACSVCSSNNFVTEGSACTDSKQCQGPYTDSKWTCAGTAPDQHCCPGGKTTWTAATATTAGGCS